MDLSKFKLGIGPMSPLLVEICLEYSKTNNYPLMLIASRNQVDLHSGYAFTTRKFVEFVRNNTNYDKERVLTCRDHCGPYYGDSDNGLSLDSAMQNCYNTIKEDIDCGFDLIHIDVSRIQDNLKYKMADKLISYATSLNPNIMLEFGSEDNLNTVDDMSLIKDDIKFSKQYNNIKYLVSSTGSLTKHTQIGKFVVERNKKLADLIHNAGFLFKEHNTDYLVLPDVILRKQAGVDAINIAPQLGVLHTTTITELTDHNTEYYVQFKKKALDSNLWSKWITDDITDDATKLKVCGHYFLNSIAAMEITKSIGLSVLKENLSKKVYEVLDGYKNGML